jgi:hypothetical protein
MRRYINIVLLALTVIIITSCGSNDKEDPIPTTKKTIQDDNNTTDNPDSGGLNPNEVTSNIAPINNTAIIDSPDYKFINPTTPIEIVESNTTYELKVQLIQNTFPVSGKTVNLRAFTNPKDIYGKFESMSTLTDGEGYAIFKYKAPDDITAVNGRWITIEAVLKDDRPVDENTTRVDLIQRFMLHFNKTNATIVSALPFVVIPNDTKVVELTENSQEVIINVNVFEGETNAPYSQGNVKVALPAKIVDGVDVGSFESYSMPIVNGKAQFKYKGPKNLNTLKKSGDNGSTFQFYHEEDPSSKKSMSVVYNPKTENAYIPTNYTLDVLSENGVFTMGIPDIEKTFTIILKDDKGDNVDKSKIKSTKIISQNIFVGNIMLEGKKVVGILSKGQNPITFNVKSNRVSGLVPITIDMNFVDANGVERNISKNINVTVFSGPPTALSISYVGVEHDPDRAKFIEKFAITATDMYGNRVNRTPTISTGAIVGYAVDGSSPTNDSTASSNKRLYFAKYDVNEQGNITPKTGTTKSIFNVINDGSERFQYVDEFNDKLVLFGEGYKYEALGKWDFDKLDNYSLELKDDYFGIQRDKLFYAIGHNKRQDPCSSDGREYVGFATVDSNTSKLDSEGTASISFKYDYDLTGKDIILWVNLSGYQADTNTTTRIGEAQKHTLRGKGLYAEPSTGYTLKAGTSGYGSFKIWHNDIPERYKNSHFSWGVADGSNCKATIIDSTNDEYKVIYDENGTFKSSTWIRKRDNRECVNGGSAFITFYLEAGLEDDCTFNIDRILPSGEF